jgi:hypothetical protein
MASCFFCGAEIPAGEKIYRNSTCTACGNPLKICRNCRFYDQSSPHECREPVSEAVKDKESANFCEYFVLTDRENPGGKTREQEHKRARDAFDKLFS